MLPSLYHALTLLFCSHNKFPRECLDLALALSKNATQFSLTQCMPPADIMEEGMGSTLFVSLFALVVCDALFFVLHSS